MKRLTIIVLLLCLMSGRALYAQRDTLEFSNEYLDSLDIGKMTRAGINDYSLLGVNYGVTFSTMITNPIKMGADFIFNPHYISVMYTHHEKMFNYIPYFGLTVGLQYSHSGVQYQNNPKTGYPLGYIDGATYESMETVEMPAMMLIHVDSGPTKIMGHLGGYLGYRLSMSRSGVYLDPEYTDKFRDYEFRFDYGLQGGVGFGLVFDPVEIHLNVWGRWSLQNLYEPDYYNPTFHPNNTYYYRYANPLDISVSLGVHFQLSNRIGRTDKELRKQAHDLVYGTLDNE